MGYNHTVTSPRHGICVRHDGRPRLQKPASWRSHPAMEPTFGFYTNLGAISPPRSRTKFCIQCFLRAHKLFAFEPRIMLGIVPGIKPGRYPGHPVGQGQKVKYCLARGGDLMAVLSSCTRKCVLESVQIYLARLRPQLCQPSAIGWLCLPAINIHSKYAQQSERAAIRCDSSRSRRGAGAGRRIRVTNPARQHQGSELALLA